MSATRPDAARISLRRNGSELVASVRGPVNGETAPSIEARLAPELSGGGALVLDLTGADYLDSDGVRWLQELAGDLAERRAGLCVVVAEGSPAQRVLRLLRLEGPLGVRAASASLPDAGEELVGTPA